MAFIDDIRTSLRISTTSLDGDIQDSIDACKLDLAGSGVAVLSETDALIKRAIKLHAKIDFAPDAETQKRFTEAYESLKRHLTVSSDYKDSLSV